MNDSTTSIMPYGPMLEALLNGAFICPVTEENFFRQLQDESVLAAVNTYLKPLNRRVVFNEAANVAYLAWNHITPPLRQQLNEHLAEMYKSLLPLLEWMLLVQEVEGRDALITAGDILKASELVLHCEDNASLRDRLRQLANDRFFNSTSDDVGLQVRQVFRRLLEHGYVIQPNRDKQIFQVTGKIDYLVEWVRFLKDEENLPVEDDVAVQESMLP